MSREPDEDGGIRYSQWVPGASDSGPDDEPRSYWERLMREEAKQKTKQPRATVMSGAFPRPDPKGFFRERTMAPARAFASSNRAIAREAVKGARRPEFGPTARELEADLREQLGIRMENGRAIYRPTAEQKTFLAEQLAARGLPAEQVQDLKFVSGLDDEASMFTRIALGSGATAVTQGNTIYVKPTAFVDVVGFNSPTPFEEAYHSADFTAEGGAGFYSPYILNALGAKVVTGDEYHGNPYEAFAKGAAKEMHEEYERQRRNKGR